MSQRIRVLFVLGVVLSGLLLGACQKQSPPAEMVTPQETSTGEPTVTRTVEIETMTPLAPGVTASPPPSATPALDSALQALIDQAHQATYEGDLDQAIVLWRQAVDESPTEQRVPLVLQLGQAYLQAGRYDMAVAQASWAAAVEAPADLHAQALGLLGTIQEASGDWRGAAESLTAYVAEEDSAAPYVWWRIARAHKALGDLSAQIGALLSIDAARLEPSFRAEVLAELASAYRANSDPNSAIQIYDQILGFATLPEYRALVQHYKGETLREASHEQEAIASFYAVANSAPESFAAYLSLQELIALPESATPEASVGGSDVISGTTTALVLTDLTRGKIHYHAQEYNLALEYLNYYLHDEPELGGAEAHYYLGTDAGQAGTVRGRTGAPRRRD